MSKQQGDTHAYALRELYRQVIAMSKPQGGTHVHCYRVALYDSRQLMVVAAGLPCSTTGKPVYLDATAKLNHNFGATAKLNHNFGAATYEEVEKSLHRYVSSVIASHSMQADSQLVDILTRCLISLYEQRLKPALWVQVVDSIIVIWCDMQFKDDEDDDKDKIGVANYGWLEIVCYEVVSLVTDSVNPTDTATVHGLLIVDSDSYYLVCEDDGVPRAVKRVLENDDYDFPAEPTATLAD